VILLLIKRFGAYRSGHLTPYPSPHPLPAITIDVYIDNTFHLGIITLSSLLPISGYCN